MIVGRLTVRAGCATGSVEIGRRRRSVVGELVERWPAHIGDTAVVAGQTIGAAGSGITSGRFAGRR